MRHARLLLAAVPILAAAAVADDAAPAAKTVSQTILNKPLWEIFTTGGDVMWLILAVSLLGAAYAAERVIGLRHRRHVPKDFEKDVVHAVDARGVDAGLALCISKPSSLSRVLHAALLRHGTSRHEMEVAVADEGVRVRYDLRRNARIVGLMACLSALLGLTGTSISLVDAFDRAGIAGTLEVLSAGVAVALVPIAFGLIAATPLCCAFLYLLGKANDIARDADERGRDAVVTLDRKARQSIRLIEDIDEHVATKDMPAVKGPPPDFVKELEVTGPREGSGVRTSIATPINLPIAGPPPQPDTQKKP